MLLGRELAATLAPSARLDRALWGDFVIEERAAAFDVWDLVGNGGTRAENVGIDFTGISGVQLIEGGGVEDGQFDVGFFNVCFFNVDFFNDGFFDVGRFETGSFDAPGGFFVF